MKCFDCPRACGVDRDAGEIGFCGGGRYARVAKTVDEFAYEEPCFGSAVTAVFFGGCALRCSYCQNYKISRGRVGREYADNELAALFDGTELPIDLVTPSHYLSAVERAVSMCEYAHEFIYNTSGYETTDAVRRAAKFCNLFLTDIKYSDDGIAAKYSGARDYFEKALAAVTEMKKLRPDVWIDGGNGRLVSGVVVRHLVLPGHADNSIGVLDAIADRLGADTVVSIMSQFTPNGVGEPTARLKKLEYKLVVEHARKLGLNIGYVQDFDSATSAYTPEFN